jgi:hypothetical protein
MSESPEQLLKCLRWEPDMLVTNHFEERVWLREAFNKSNIRCGITECCFEEDPCKWHLTLSKTTLSTPAIINTQH